MISFSDGQYCHYKTTNIDDIDYIDTINFQQILRFQTISYILFSIFHIFEVCFPLIHLIYFFRIIFSLIHLNILGIIYLDVYFFSLMWNKKRKIIYCNFSIVFQCNMYIKYESLSPESNPGILWRTLLLSSLLPLVHMILNLSIQLLLLYSSASCFISDQYYK